MKRKTIVIVAGLLIAAAAAGKVMMGNGEQELLEVQTATVNLEPGRYFTITFRPETGGFHFR